MTDPTTNDYSLNPQLSYLGTKTRLEFIGSCLKQDKITFNHGKVVNIYIVYELEQSVWLKFLVLISTNILVMELDLIEVMFIQ